MASTDDELRVKIKKCQGRDKTQRLAIEAYGVDLSRERKIDLTFWAPNESQAKVLSEALARNEMSQSRIMGPASGEPNQRWMVQVSILASVDFMTTEENLVTFILFADKYDCEYDGWGTAIVEVLESSSNNPED